MLDINSILHNMHQLNEQCYFVKMPVDLTQMYFLKQVLILVLQHLMPDLISFTM